LFLKCSIPDEIELRIGKVRSVLRAGAESQFLTIDQADKIDPVELSVQPTFGQFVQIRPKITRIENIPSCMAIEIIGLGGDRLPTSFCGNNRNGNRNFGK